MISVDTNVVVRFLTRDDEAQFIKAQDVFLTHDVFVADTVVLETEWVLRYAYNSSAEVIVKGFRKLLGLPNVSCSHPEILKEALMGVEKGLDFADSLHLAHSQHCRELKTFDKHFAKNSVGLSTCPVHLL